ncbi:hypothetical protein M231_05062 [Tremella mesenterica]|uniref:Uncharacterized protein n=1 Tax=Tremella mesenterica TaxID=5217 RepID=A0A4Q1BJ34_TREME|nr:hypothetical protein M231_05062 [Tremella mesenterica]
MSSLVANIHPLARLTFSAMTDARMSRPHHHHPQPSYGHSAGPTYSAPPPGAHPSYQHHSSRHVPNGPSGPAVGHPGQMIAGPSEVAPPNAVSNGHARGTPVPSGISAVARAGKEKQESIFAQLAIANENTWTLIGAVAEQMRDENRALSAFENAIRHNPNSISALNAAASIHRSRDNFDKAIEYFERILNIKQDNGEVWGSMGHCLLMKDDLPKAYTAYQQALYHLSNPKEPKLWYGIGILYDRYGSFEHAEEAFSSVLKMDPNFDKANEIYFRLGIIYKHQRKYQASLDCFRYILNNPPRPLTTYDIWFQLGHVYEQDRDYEAARDAYMRVLSQQPDHAKVLQQLGWLYHQPGAPFADQEKAVEYLTKSLETENTDAQSWYLLGRAFMSGQRYNKAYEAYQQAVYRDGRNPTFWCSIGVLYYQINQYRDALDAYSRAIRLNPFISEVWYNLGSLYESCNNQITDAIDAYTRATDLDPNNTAIKQRLQMLHNVGNNNGPLPPAPGPVDVHPSAYSAAPAQNLPTQGSPAVSPRPGQHDIRGDGPIPSARDLAPPETRAHSPPLFRGGAVPPPLNHVDESRGAMSRHAPLAPIEVDRSETPRERDIREGPASGGGTRFDPGSEMSHRRAESPTSPRRREVYHGHPAHPSVSHKDREREEKEWRERSRGPQMGAVMDPRGPSPRLQERGPPSHGPRHPSPRISEYGRPPAFPEQPYGYYDNRAPPPGPGPFEPQRRYDEASNGQPGPGHRHASASRDLRPDDLRAPSPALSMSSKAGSKRKAGQTDERSKRTRDDKTPGSGKKAGPGSAKQSGFRGGMEETSPRPTNASSPAGSMSSTHQQTPRHPAPPSRTIDEDYDEGAADALMTLHGDRPSINGTSRSVSTSPIASLLQGNGKRPDPPSPAEANLSHKRPKADINLPGSSPARVEKEKEKRMVIEVLNTPRISSPMPGPWPVSTSVPGVISQSVTPRDEKEASVVKSPSVKDDKRREDEMEKTTSAKSSPVKETSRSPTRARISGERGTPPVLTAEKEEGKDEDVVMEETAEPRPIEEVKAGEDEETKKAEE